jgi:hypothetical protein
MSASGPFASILARLPHVQLRGNLGSSGCPILAVEGIGLAVIQATKREPRIMRYELTDFEWAAIESLLPNKPRGIRRVDAVAIREGHAFADTVFGKRPVEVDHADIPTAVFSQPEIGTVGLTEAQARAHFSHVDIYKTDFRPIKSTMSGRDTRVLMKLVVDGSTDRVVGCHVVGDGAAEIVQVLGIAVKMKATKADFDATMALHPTAAEELVTMRTPTARYVRQAAE